MRAALYARTSAADAGRVTVEEILAKLRSYAGRRGWDVSFSAADRGPWLDGARPGLNQVTVAIRDRKVDILVVQSLTQLARDVRHLAELGESLHKAGIALVAVDEVLDSTEPGGALRWRDWVEIAAKVARRTRQEAALVARLRSANGDAWGRPNVAVNPLELLALWEGRAGHRPLSGREMAKRMGVSATTVRTRLAELREAGRVNDAAREQRLAAGGPRKGGRPARPLADDDVRAAWARAPSVSALARSLRVSYSRLTAKLRALGLLEAGHEQSRQGG